MAESCGVILDTERFHKNPFLEREKTFDVFEKGVDSFENRLEEARSALSKRLLDKILSEGLGQESTVYTGSTGVLHTIGFITSKGYNETISEAVVDDLIKDARGKKVCKKKCFTFLCGEAGPLLVAHNISKDALEKDKFLRSILDLQDEVLHDTNNGSNELMYGRAGYLYCLLFLNQHSQLISPYVISKVVTCIIEDGLKNRKASGPPLHYEWHDKLYLGAAHGYVGILYMLLKAREYMKIEHVSKVKETLDWILLQQFPSGNLPSSVGSKNDKLIHWCHGSPGQIFLFLEAAKVFEDDKDRYLSSALASGEVVWKRGILKRSYSLCHGTAGNAYALMALYKHTKDSKWLKRSCLFAEFCFSWGKYSTKPDRPNSLFEGLSGTVYMLHDFHNFLFKGVGGGSGSSPKFPAFELD